MRNVTKHGFVLLMFVIGASMAAHADPCVTADVASAATPSDCNKNTAPEVDPSLAVAGISLLAGTLAVVRTRNRK